MLYQTRLYGIKKDVKSYMFYQTRSWICTHTIEQGDGYLHTASTTLGRIRSCHRCWSIISSKIKSSEAYVRRMSLTKITFSFCPYSLARASVMSPWINLICRVSRIRKGAGSTSTKLTSGKLTSAKYAMCRPGAAPAYTTVSPGWLCKVSNSSSFMNSLRWPQ